LAAVATRAASSIKGEFDMSKTIHKYVYLAAMCVALGMVFARCSLHAEVILSEIMYDPQDGAANREWVELFNTGASSVHIGGWPFGLPTNNDWANALPANTMLGAGQALVLTPSSATLDSDWGSGINRIQVGNFPALTNDPNDHVNAA